MLLASVLAIGAGSLAGCGDTDCPSAITPGDSCSAAGLGCSIGSEYCTCLDGRWACMDDLPDTVIRDMARHDLATSDAGPPGD